MKKYGNDLNKLGAFSRWKVSATINQNLVHSLIHNDSFKDDIKNIRNKLGINTIGYEYDFNEAFFTWLEIEEYGEDGEPDFHFLRFNREGSIENKNLKQKVIGEEALSVLKSYKLPANFLYWVIDYVLFNEAPPWMPYFNYIPIEDLQLQTVHKLPLTTQEKRALKRDIKFINKKLNGDSHFSVEHKEAIKAISEAYNFHRKLHNSDRDLKIVEEMEKRISKKGKLLKSTSYVDTLRKKGLTDEKIIQMSKQAKQDYGKGFASFDVQRKYTSKHIEAKFAREKVKKNKGAFARKRLERLKKYANKKIVN